MIGLGRLLAFLFIVALVKDALRGTPNPTPGFFSPLFVLSVGLFLFFYRLGGQRIGKNGIWSSDRFVKWNRIIRVWIGERPCAADHNPRASVGGSPSGRQIGGPFGG